MMCRRAMVAVLAITSQCLCILSLRVAFLAPNPHHRRPQALSPSVSPSGSLVVAPAAKSPASARDDNVIVEQPEQESGDIPEIMALIEQTYPESNSDNSNNNKKRWTKTRKYLYQYRAASLPKISNSTNNKSISEEEWVQTKRKRRRQNHGPLTITQIQKILSFLQSTFPDHPHLQAKILQQSPRILGQCNSIESRLIPTVEFLHGLYGDMSGSDGQEGGMFYEAIERNTNLLLVRGVGYAGRGSKNVDLVDEEDGGNISEVEDYLQEELRISSTGIAKLKRNHPTLFQLSLKGKVKPVIHFLSLMLGHSEEASVSLRSKQMKQVAKIVTNHPMLLQLDVAANLEPTACFFRDSCELTDKELATVVAATPGVLGLSVQGNLKPTMQFLEDILKRSGMQQLKESESISEDDASKIMLRKCILKHPQILALSLNNLRAKKEYFDGIDGNISLQTEDGKNDTNKASLAGRILAGAPSVYSLSLTENIIPKVDYLASLWSNSMPTPCTKEGKLLSDNLREYPQILTLSKEGNIIPTLSFYNMTGYISLDVNGVPQQPQSSMQQQRPNYMIRSRYIATSLYNRLLPRWHFLIQEQEKMQLERQLDSLVNADPKYVIPTSTSGSAQPTVLPPMHLLAGASDEVFCRQMKLSLVEYLAFKEQNKSSLKFSSQFDRWLKTGHPIDLIATS